MTYKIMDIEGIGPAYGDKLSAVEIKTTDDLLSFCASSKGREQIAGRSGLSEKLLLRWTNMADLMRISGVGPEYAELLEAAGVDTVKELRRRNAENLAVAMKSVNEERKLTRSVPATSQVVRWVEAANGLEPTITY